MTLPFQMLSPPAPWVRVRSSARRLGGGRWLSSRWLLNPGREWVGGGRADSGRRGRRAGGAWATEAGGRWAAAGGRAAGELATGGGTLWTGSGGMMGSRRSCARPRAGIGPRASGGWAVGGHQAEHRGWGADGRVAAGGSPRCPLRCVFKVTECIWTSPNRNIIIRIAKHNLRNVT